MVQLPSRQDRASSGGHEASVAVDQAFPLELKVPNAQTRRAMAESEEMMKRGTARFDSADEMFAKLGESGGQ